ncbi:MAG: glycosyl hydrolase [Actinobacteria bacterium]|nr:glycosyl hydrolase [Actinomycetota bacterium]
MHAHPRLSEIAALVTTLLVLASALVALTIGGDGLTAPERHLAAQRPVGEPASDWFLSARGGADLDPAAGTRARAEAADARHRTAATDPALAEAPWTWLGPQNIGGRVLDIALDPAGTDTVYVATAGGGVWKSTDAGVTLAPSWPDVAPQAVAAIAAAPDETLYAGTGEPPPGGGSITWAGDGIYRSTDGAQTWENIGLSDSGTISEIVVDSRGTIWVASMGHGFAEGGERGLYRSDDGGESWTVALEAPNGRTGASDIAIDPADPDHLFVTMWQRIRLPDRRLYGGPGSTVWESHDGGATWESVDAITAQDSRRQPGRIALSFAPSDASRVYAIVVDDLGGFDSFYRSDDGGATWTQTGDSFLDTSQSSYGWWFGRIWVDPDEPDVLFAGGVDLVWSDDGGDSWLPQSSTIAGVVTGVTVVNPHADQHDMVWDERVPGRVYLANDGGLYRSDADGRLDWKGALQQGFTQHYSVGVSQQQPSRVVSGLQDNMCQRNYVAGDLGQPQTWTKYGLCGDGLQTLIHPTDDRIVYGCAQYGGNCSRSDDGGGAFAFMRIPGDRHNWWAPIAFDPSDPTVMYAGSNVVSRGATAGGVRPGQTGFAVISPDLTSTAGGAEQPDPQYEFGTITTLAVAPSDGNVLYVGTDEGWLWRGELAGPQWGWERIDTETDVPEDERVLPDGLSWVSRVAVDPGDADVAYATFSRYRNGEDTPLVVKTTDGGASWTDITGDLPDAPVNEIVVLDDSARLVVGTDVGVFLSDDGGTSWKAVGTGLPTSPVLDIATHTSTDLLSGASTTYLTAATFGRGIMRVALPSAE